jgi:CBS domain-containing protein
MNSYKNTEDILIKRVMTRKPIQVSSDILAAEALSVFEKNNISVLPVVDKSIIKGIITMQDLIKSIN